MAGIGNISNDVELTVGGPRRQNVPGTHGPFNGVIDEVAIFNRVLSASEIQTIFAAGSAGMCKPTACEPSEECEQALAAARQRIIDLEAQLADANAKIKQLTEANEALTIDNGLLKNELKQLKQTLENGLTAVRDTLRTLFNDPAFVIPGTTLQEQYQNLIKAIANLNKGRAEGLYVNLGGKPGK